jgi:SAM-dependent methyltransferase
MGTERDAAWYDARWLEREKHYLLTPDKLTHYPLWRQAATWATATGRDVLDLGCGAGALAQLLADDPQFFSMYRGVDFSGAALAMAKTRNLSLRFRFECVDLSLTGSVVMESRVHPPAVILCELLEHISRDIPLLAGLPTGTPTWFSLPLFDDPAHVRHFISPTEIVARYGPLFDQFSVTEVRHRGRVSWYACLGERSDVNHT